MKLKEIIHELLVKYPSLRDSDNKLTANIWHAELKKLDKEVDLLTARGLLEAFAENKLSNPTSIRRHRARFQELMPELRGDKYKIRQGVAQKDWINKIKKEGSYKSIKDKNKPNKPNL